MVWAVENKIGILNVFWAQLFKNETSTTEKRFTSWLANIQGKPIDGKKNCRFSVLHEKIVKLLRILHEIR